MKVIPQILVSNGVLTIIINAEELKWVTEHKPDSAYEVLDSNRFLSDFAATLENYASSNATELGISELQHLFDTVIDETYTNCSEAIVIKRRFMNNEDQINRDCMELFEQSIGKKVRVKGTPLVDEITGVNWQLMTVKVKTYGEFGVRLCELTNEEETQSEN